MVMEGMEFHPNKCIAGNHACTHKYFFLCHPCRHPGIHGNIHNVMIIMGLVIHIMMIRYVQANMREIYYYNVCTAVVIVAAVRCW